MPESVGNLPANTQASKLRSSCDSCGAAKTKCDHIRPKCGRCIKLGQNCVYGISRRVGKPSRKRPGVNLDAEPKKKRMILSAESNTNHRGTGSGQPQSINDFEQHKALSMTNDMMLWPSDINNSYNINEQSQFCSGVFTSIFDEWPQLDNLETNIGFPFSSNSDISMSIQSNRQESHSCARESYEILRDLICPLPDLHAPESNSGTVSASLDQVLHCNRTAIDRLSRLLKCPCSKSGHRIMVHASIVSRILIWYQQAAGWNGRCTPERRFSMIEDSSTSRKLTPFTQTSKKGPKTTPTTSLSLTQLTGFVVAQVPVSMGTFSVEDQNIQADFRYQLILSELKKTEKLIELFESLDSCESKAIGLAELYPHLGAWLRSEHSRTVKILESRLGILE